MAIYLPGAEALVALFVICCYILAWDEASSNNTLTLVFIIVVADYNNEVLVQTASWLG